MKRLQWELEHRKPLKGAGGAGGGKAQAKAAMLESGQRALVPALDIREARAARQPRRIVVRFPRGADAALVHRREKIERRDAQLRRRPQRCRRREEERGARECGHIFCPVEDGRRAFCLNGCAPSSVVKTRYSTAAEFAGCAAF